MESNLTSIDPEFERLKKALEENEELMRQAAIKYEDLIAAKEALEASLQAHKTAKNARSDKF